MKIDQLMDNTPGNIFKTAILPMNKQENGKITRIQG